MRTLLLAALLLPIGAAIPAQARAATPAATVQVTTVVTVPLHASLDAADLSPHVAVSNGDKQVLLRLATGHAELRLSEGAAKKLGGKVSGKGDKKRASFESWKLGEASFADITAKVVEGPALRGADGEIGLGALEGVAWAVLPSKGEVRIAPASQAEALLGAVGGTPLTWTRESKRKQKIGEGPKVELPEAPVILSVTWSGVSVPARVAIERSQSSVNAEVDGAGSWYKVKGSSFAPSPLPAAPGVPDGSTREEWREVSVGGASGWARVARPVAGMRSAFDVNARIGADVLSAFDLALDPATSRIALRKADSVTRVEWAPEREKALRGALEAKPDADEKAKAAARKGGIPALADFLASRGKLDEAVKLRQELTTLDAGACASWLGYGNALVKAGRVTEAVEPLRRSAELYAPWSALSLAERRKVEAEKAKTEKKGGTWEGATPQEHVCHTANGSLALALVAAGRPADVAELYPAKLDLDARLPLAAGTAALVAGQADRAEAAFRQAVTMAKSKEPLEARAGLALALRARDATLATAQLERTRFASSFGTDPQLVRTWFAGAEARLGRAAAVEALARYSAEAPWDAVLLTEYARALGTDAQAAQAWKSAEARVRALPTGALSHALRAFIALGSGDAVAAKAAAQAAVTADSTHPVAWLAASEAHAAVGDATAATEARRRAAMTALDNPAWASLLGG